MADIVSTLINQAVAKRAMLLEQWLVNHMEHWPGPQLYDMVNEPLVRHAKCSCGAELDVVITITVTLQSSEP